MVSSPRLVAVGLALLALACGSSESDGPQVAGGGAGQAGTTATSAGSSSGGSNSGGSSSGGTAGGGTAGGGGKGLMLGNTPAEACIEYAVAVCTRREECNMAATDNCLRASLGCPDLTASPGATRTVEGLKACAETYKTFPCEQVKANVLPACVTPGARQQGEACVYPSQCSSLNCERTDSNCGKCAKEAALGESCQADDVGCGPGLYCSAGNSPVCILIDPTYDVPANGACTIDERCVAGYTCSAGTCQPVPKVGDACPMGQCGEKQYCAGGVCQASPVLGQPCGLDGTGQATVCDYDFVCVTGATPQTGTCQLPPGVGQPCWPYPGRPEDFRCATGLRCNQLVSPVVCELPGKPGTPCTTTIDCETALSCSCPPSTPDCTSPTCSTIVLGGERCDVANTVCHPAFMCEAGACKVRDSQGTFAEACTMP